MSASVQLLNDIGLNGFGVELVAESILREKQLIEKPFEFVLPVRRSDCKGWAGVRFKIEAISDEQWDKEAGKKQKGHQ